MLLRLPKNLHYPITVTKVIKPAGEQVERGDHLFLYSYEAIVTEGSRDGVEKDVRKRFMAQFESSLDGTLRTWRIWEGDVIAQP
jgi:RNA polymerase II subunit A-like phosphatase